MHLLSGIFLSALVILSGCTSQGGVKKPVLTDNERKLCSILKLDSGIITYIRKFTTAPVEPFDYSSPRYLYPGDKNHVEEPEYLQGLVFDQDAADVDSMVSYLYDSLRGMDYSVFIYERNYGYNKQKDKIGVLKATDQFDVLKKILSEGINYDIDNDSLINIIKTLDKKYSLKLTGASYDWCEFTIGNQPRDWLPLAKEAYKICPDIVDQGEGSIEDLAAEIKKTGRLYLWWD